MSIVNVGSPHIDSDSTAASAKSWHDSNQLESLQPTAERLSISLLLNGLAILVFIVALGFVAAAMYESLNNREAQVKSMPSAEMEVTKLREEQLAKLNDYRWVNQAEGVLSIPIDRAMQLTIERSQPSASTGR